MNIYFINKAPDWWNKGQTKNMAFMGSQCCEDIQIMVDMPLFMTVWVIFHEFFHWLDWKIPWRRLGDGLLRAYIRVSGRLWEKYEWISELVARRWRRRCRNV